MSIPTPSIERLTKMLRILETSAEDCLSSADLSALSGWPRDTIRKDISYLSSAPSFTKGYKPQNLALAIKKDLGLENSRHLCIVGLGQLGYAFLKYQGFTRDGFELVAAFDQNINRLEVLSATIPLYPSFKLKEVVQTKKIEMALLCVPDKAVTKVVSDLVEAGIKSILNFSATLIETPPGVLVRNIYIGDDLRILAATQHVQNPLSTVFNSGPSDR